ncbi:hypothetical protein FOCG_17548 [Fusarium oxysporum f. sp. radicis-lycopersici 26381]|nr:hypothetical protein FOCG_17548 [Fusarium oxysporum f. sp. radicis-lycopersici 26381]
MVSPKPIRGPSRVLRKVSYSDMVLAAHECPFALRFIAAASNWLLLAGFVVFPGAFTSLSRMKLLSESQAGRNAQYFIHNTPLLAIGILCCSIGSAGIGWVSWKCKGNYVWLVDRIFVPGLLNSVVALLMSVVNIYTAQNGEWSITAVVTVSIIGVWGTITALMLVVYELCFLRKLRQEQ